MHIRGIAKVGEGSQICLHMAKGTEETNIQTLSEIHLLSVCDTTNARNTETCMASTTHQQFDLSLSNARIISKNVQFVFLLRASLGGVSH